MSDAELKVQLAVEAVIERVWRTPRVDTTMTVTPDEQRLLDALEEIAKIVDTSRTSGEES